MSKVMRFPRYSTVTAVPGDGVYVTTELGRRTRLHGRAIHAAYPLLDGTRSRAQVIAELLPHVGDQAANLTIERLEAAGHVVEVDGEVDPTIGGYWDQLGVDGDLVVDGLAHRRIDLLVLTDTDIGDPVSAVTRAGLPRPRLVFVDDVVRGDAQPTADLLLVLADDYRNEHLSAIDEACRRVGLTWMLCKPVGTSVWVGPIFERGVTACYTCLSVRLQGKSLTESYLRQRGAVSGGFVESRAALPSTTALALDLAVHRAGLHLAGVVVGTEDGVGPADPTRAGDVVTIDTATLATRRHHLDPRPQCRTCGDPQRQARADLAPVHLPPLAKARTEDGGHRASSPEDFVATYERLVSPITGPVSQLVALPQAAPGLHVYVAGQNFAMPMRNIADLKAGLRSSSSGKGISRIQAKASALGEAIERYSGLFHGDECQRFATLDSLPADEVIQPNDVHLFSAEQLRDRDTWNARPSHFHWVGEALPPDLPVGWSPLWSLTEQRHKWAPTSMLYYNYNSVDHPFRPGANSNGCAAGASLQDAILQGFMELVERDATAIWWYNRLRVRAIDITAFGDPYFAHWTAQYAALNRRTWLLDITTDLGIPTVVAVSYRVDKPVQDILFALGSHFDVRIAIGRAMSEMNQFLTAVAHMPADGTGRYLFDDPCQVEWWSTATLEAHPYLVPDGSIAPAGPADFVDRSTDDLAADVRVCQEIVERAGMEMLVLDQTRPDIGLPVARVVVPGMRHFWPRYAPGRLFDVPVRRGQLPAPTPESDLNPVAMFL
ncbi:MAG TPA: TOMM precursor leader peptide-binding protein [Dermatophilaceae bacterium]|nr:TOMM precursor leader peptide-binding protein [Dermatophilaceae bacterium]HPZ68730.1 TOMM precursor leader peptide-binding protein [Dermatophilaceae bacterium]HQD00763.1 TOMM precursor leader peptide-binding protein [Dermatophilaceae bacterium]